MASIYYEMKPIVSSSLPFMDMICTVCVGVEEKEKRGLYVCTTAACVSPGFNSTANVISNNHQYTALRYTNFFF